MKFPMFMQKIIPMVSKTFNISLGFRLLKRKSTIGAWSTTGTIGPIGPLFTMGPIGTIGI